MILSIPPGMLSIDFCGLSQNISGVSLQIDILGILRVVPGSSNIRSKLEDLVEATKGVFSKYFAK